ncbi:MAG: YraN family protein [Cyanobacteria bacterium P01_G01_bin.19]
MTNIGTLGEELVGRWLELHNYRLLKQNWRSRWGEIDIIAREKNNNQIAFVEVKTRSANNWDRDGLLAVDATKQAKIIQTASWFLAKHPRWAESPCRFDVAVVSCKNYSPPGQEKIPIKWSSVSKIEIGQPVIIEEYQLTIKDYLISAFD